MKALVTGATGFIGGALTRRLVSDGWSVRVLVRPSSRWDRLGDLPVEVVPGDVLRPESVRRAVAGVDVVFHCAANVNLVAPDRRQMLRTNVEGTRNVLQASLDAEVRRVVHLSSVAALGLEGNGTADETGAHPGVYRTPYDESKHRAELLVGEFAQRGLDVVLVLPSVVIGPGDPKTGDVFVRFLRRRLPVRLRETGGTGYVHIDDLVEGILLAYRRGRTGERYIFNQANWTHDELLGRLQRLSGVAAPRRRIGVRTAAFLASVLLVATRVARRAPLVDPAMVRLGARRMRYSSEKSRRELGWDPHDFEERFAQTVRWWQEWVARHDR